MRAFRKDGGSLGERPTLRFLLSYHISDRNDQNQASVPEVVVRRLLVRAMRCHPIPCFRGLGHLRPADTLSLSLRLAFPQPSPAFFSRKVPKAA